MHVHKILSGGFVPFIFPPQPHGTNTVFEIAWRVALVVKLRKLIIYCQTFFFFFFGLFFCFCLFVVVVVVFAADCVEQKYFSCFLRKENARGLRLTGLIPTKPHNCLTVMPP